MRAGINTVGRTLGILLFAVPLLAAALDAQESVTLEPGTRIRVTAPALQEQLPRPSLRSTMWGDPYAPADPRAARVTRTVLATDPDSLIFHLAMGKVRTALPRHGIEVLERHPGGRMRAGLVGALIGVSAGAALGWSMGADCVKQWPTTTHFCLSPREAAVSLGMYAGGVGAAIGASFVPDWVLVPLPAQVSLGREPGGKVELSASRRF